MKNLFSRFAPNAEIFRPLTGVNRRLFWDLIVLLYDAHFGPDAELTRDEGIRKKHVLASIQTFLLNNDSWASEEDDPSGPATPLEVRAAGVLRRMIATGWMVETRIGVRDYVSMERPVAAFLEQLKTFAEEGPQFLGGKIQSVSNNLKAVEADPVGQAGCFSEAADQARRVISTLSNTGVKVREVMASLSAEASTSEYISAFFKKYVVDLFISDYRELRTRNHPLRGKENILRIVADLREDPDRRALLKSGYQKFMLTADEHLIEDAMRRDFLRFRRFEDVDLHLARLDASITRAVSQGTAFITYQLRTRGRLERLIEQCVDAVKAADDSGVAVEVPWAPGMLFGQQDLREPRSVKPAAARTRIQSRKPTLEELARFELQKAMTRNREVSTRQVRLYLSRQMAGRARMTSDELRIESINDLVVYAALGRAALARSVERNRYRADGVTASIPGLNLTLAHGEVSDNNFLASARFVVEWEQRK